MKIAEIVEKTEAPLETVEEALLTSGFPVDDDVDYKQDEVRIAKLYIRYLVMMQKAEEEAHGFRYVDGEETIDKKDVNDNMRRTAEIWFNRWQDEMRKLEEKKYKTKYTNFHIRGRA